MANYTKDCEYCGTEFNCNSKLRKFCSRKCSNRTQVSTIPTCDCEQCGTQFQPRTRTKSNRFCSHKCYSESLKKNYTQNCELCGAEYKLPSIHKATVRKYCSYECAREANRKIYTLDCEICGKTVEAQEHTRGRKRFCSIKCRRVYMSDFMSGDNNPNWKDAGDYYRGKNWFVQRRKACNRDGYTCQICGYKRTKGKKKRLIDVHHIIPYREFNGDYKKANKLSNLITLCRTCHAKVEHGKLSCPKRLL